MLLKVIHGEDGTETLKNMHVPHFPEMALFTANIIYSTEPGFTDSKIIVTHHQPRSQSPTTEANTNADAASTTETNNENAHTLSIPLTPDVRGLAELGIVMHSSPTKGYNMGKEYNEWFSECFGYRVVLAYLGPNWRPVLGSFPPSRSAAHREERSVSLRGAMGLLGSVLGLMVLVGVVNFLLSRRLWMILWATGATLLLSAFGTRGFGLVDNWNRDGDEKITFADAAPYLIASQTSVDNVSGRLAGDESMDVTKFRPNIVVSGAETAFEEDFWAELRVGEEGARLLLTQNCVRCKSVNVDYATGKIGTGQSGSGSVLKKLMIDRRVDRGAKYSPVFGRYGFLDRGSERAMIQVGDRVMVSKRLEEHTVFGELNYDERSGDVND